MIDRLEKITKSNDLITASYSLTMREQRLLLAAISLCNPTRAIPEKITITADYYNSVFNSKNPYRDMKLAAQSLYERSVLVQNKDEEGEMRWLAEKWQSKAEDKGGGYVRLVFTQSLKKYLSELSGYFTSYEIRMVSKFTSAYAFRIFEMLIMFRRTGWMRIGVDDLRQRLDLPDSYSSVTNIRKKILDVALAEINQSSGLTVEYEVSYKGRRAVAFTFFFHGKGVGEGDEAVSEPKAKAVEVPEADRSKEDAQISEGESRAENDSQDMTDLPGADLDRQMVSEPAKEIATDDQGEMTSGEKASPEVYGENITTIRANLKMKPPRK